MRGRKERDGGKIIQGTPCMKKFPLCVFQFGSRELDQVFVFLISTW